MSWQGKKVFVTGAGGFIGSHLTSMLVRAGADVTAMLHYGSRANWDNLDFLPGNEKASLRVVKGCVEDMGFMERSLVDQEIVFHLAALIGIPYSYVAPHSYVRTNIEGTVNVLEAVRKHGLERMVHTSTSEVYGTALYTPIDENHPLQAQSPYSATKMSADKIAESYFRTFETPVATVRPFNTYGPRQSARAIIPTIISQAMGQDHIKLGDLAPIRDLNYAEDTARGFMMAALSDKSVGEVINLGHGKGICIGDLAALILDIMGSNKDIVTDSQRVRPKGSEVLELVCTNAKANQLMNWSPQVSLRQGLAHTIEFVSNNLDFFQVGSYTV